MTPSFVIAVAGMVLRRPGLWWTTIRQVFRLAPNGWWHQWPFLPIPPPEYVEFRLKTMYGDSPPNPADMVDYLEWCRGYAYVLRKAHRDTRRSN